MIPRNEAGFRALGWWRTMQPDPDRARPGDRAGDRAALARLRRCATVAEAMQEPAAMHLFRAVQATGPGDLPAVGLAAAVLAHVRADKPGLSVARLIGPNSLETPETALLKPLRFRRVMEADGPEERLTALRRLVALAGGSLPVRDLAAALLDWTDKRRRDWVFDYWNALPVSANGTPNAMSAPNAVPSEDAIP